MNELIVTLSVVLPFIPAIIVDFTNGLKPLVRDSLIFLLPYAISFILFGGLFLVFGKFPLGIYALNSVLFAFSATKSYDSTKKDVQESIQRKEDETEKEKYLSSLQHYDG